MASKATTPPCPACKTNKQGVAANLSGDSFRCGKCGGFFDDTDPDEGGTYSDRNPAARLEREEREHVRRKLGKRR